MANAKVQMWIGGAAADAEAGGLFQRANPLTGEVATSAPAATKFPFVSAT